MPHRTANKLAFRCRLDGFTGYGQFCTQLARELLRRGFPLEVFPLSREDRFAEPPFEVVNAIPPYANSRQPWELVCYSVTSLPEPTPGKGSVVWTMWESTRLPESAVRRLNQYDLVLVPSLWCATVFSASGVNRPIRVVPLGIDTEVFCPLGDCLPSLGMVPDSLPRHCAGLRRMKSPTEPFVFGTAAGMANSPHRKGFDRVVKAFKRAFSSSENVRLRVKALPGDPLAGDQGDSNIEVVKEFFPSARLADWFRGLDVFVSDSGGEGWGLMQQQAMACGVPLVAARYGGVAEFFDAAAGWAVPFTLKPGCGPYEDHGLQAQMNEADLAMQLRCIAILSDGKVRHVGRNAAEAVEAFTVARSADELLAVLCEEGFRLT